MKNGVFLGYIHFMTIWGKKYFLSLPIKTAIYCTHLSPCPACFLELFDFHNFVCSFMPLDHFFFLRPYLHQLELFL